MTAGKLADLWIQRNDHPISLGLQRIATQIDLTAAGGRGIVACSAPVGVGAPPTGA